MNKGDELSDVTFCNIKLLKHDPSWNIVKGVCHIQNLKDDPSKVQIKSPPNVMDDYFAPTFCGHSKLMGKKGFTKLKN
jgi:hypothetical protein